eukprot:scaffold1472_cov157-Skeletonema_menzelii.AAC.1
MALSIAPLSTTKKSSCSYIDDASTACDGWQICTISIQLLDAARKASSTLAMHPEMYPNGSMGL